MAEAAALGTVAHAKNARPSRKLLPLSAASLWTREGGKGLPSISRHQRGAVAAQLIQTSLVLPAHPDVRRLAVVPAVETPVA
jgi:hypothetical protein